MLKTVNFSRSKKTFGCAVTYRAGEKHHFGTCPADCSMNDSGCGTSSIDNEYLDALVDAVPRNGKAFTYTHFSPKYWYKKLKPNKTVINYSADTTKDAISKFKRDIPTVTVVSPDFWDGKKAKKVDDVTFVRCPAEFKDKTVCSNCGNGRPLCSELDRNFVVGFTAHGAKKKKAQNANEKGGCYADGGNVRIHWVDTMEQLQENQDARKLKDFVRTLPNGTILRHHVAGDFGEEK